MYRKIKLHYPTATVIEATLRAHLPAKPGDIVVVFDPTSTYIGNITILSEIDDSCPFNARFVAPVTPDPSCVLFHWTYAYKVPEGYASVEAQND